MLGVVDRDSTQTNESSEQEQEGEESAAIGALSHGLMANQGGSALPPGVRGKMERSFGTDFSAVRVHQGSGMAAELGADAFAQGTDLHFAPGKYDPDSEQGHELIGHELAHVVQQRGRAAAPQAHGADLGGSAALEREADAAGAAAARGQPARVSGVASGVQFKRSRAWLDAKKLTEAPRIAKARVKDLENRLAAKAELRLTNTDDGGLIRQLEEAASNRVKEIAAEKLQDATQKSDVEALSAKIAQRSKAVKQAVSAKARTIAEAIAAGHLATFQQKAEAAFDNTSVTKLSIKALVIEQAKVSAKLATGRIAEREYQTAKLALDAKLTADKTQIETDLIDDSRTRVEPRAKAATRKREAVDAKITRIAQEAEEPVFKGLHDDVEKYLTHKLGAKGANWMRSDELREFRKQMKTAGRKQAKEDVDTELGGHTELGGARKRYVGMSAKIDVYDEAKQSVNTKLTEVATQMTDQLLRDKDISINLLAEARRAAFAVYEDEGHMMAAKTAAASAARAYAKAKHAELMEEARTRKNAIVKDSTTSQERQDIEAGVIQQVQDDEVGKRSVNAAIKASSPEKGMAKLGHFFDFIVPERGDAVKFKVSLEVPAGPGNILLELQGDAERGTRERLIQKENGAKKVKRDTQSLKLGVEIRVGYSGTLPGIKLQGALGFFMRSDAASTDMCMKALSYGIYRFLSGAIPPLANLWGGSHKKAKAMSQIDPNNPDDDLGDDVYRSELWAAMIEEEVFKKDKEARVDLGMSFNAGAEVDGGVAKAKGGLRGEVMRTYDHQALKNSIRRYNAKQSSNVSLADAGFDKAGAKQRRQAITGRTTGGFLLENEVEVDIAGQKCVFGLKVSITPPAFEIEISGGLKISSSDPAQKETRLIAGIASAAQNGLKMIVSIVRNLIDKDHALAGVLGDISDAATRSLVDVNNMTNNLVGDKISQGYQVAKGQEDYANQGINELLGGSKPDPGPSTKAGFSSEQLYKVSIITGNAKPFMIKIDEVQTQKLGLGGQGGPGLNLEYEKSRRVGQIGISDGKFHAEGLGVSTRT